MAASVTRGETSTEVCAVECGARCCRAPARLLVTEDELDRLAELADARGVTITVVPVATRRDPTTRAGSMIVHADQPGGVCPFLIEASNLCSIYEDRPDACRRFPTKPEPGCVLWPKS